MHLPSSEPKGINEMSQQLESELSEALALKASGIPMETGQRLRGIDYHPRTGRTLPACDGGFTGRSSGNHRAWWRRSSSSGARSRRLPAGAQHRRQARRRTHLRQPPPARRRSTAYRPCRATRPGRPIAPGSHRRAGTVHVGHLSERRHHRVLSVGTVDDDRLQKLASTETPCPLGVCLLRRARTRDGGGPAAADR